MASIDTETKRAKAAIAKQLQSAELKDLLGRRKWEDMVDNDAIDAPVDHAAAATPGEDASPHLRKKRNMNSGDDCFSWLRSGRCRYGDRCYFQHEAEKASSDPQAGESRQTGEKGNKNYFATQVQFVSRFAREEADDNNASGEIAGTIDF